MDRWTICHGTELTLIILNSILLCCDFNKLLYRQMFLVVHRWRHPSRLYPSSAQVPVLKRNLYRSCLRIIPIQEMMKNPLPMLRQQTIQTPLTMLRQRTIPILQIISHRQTLHHQKSTMCSSLYDATMIHQLRTPSSSYLLQTHFGYNDMTGFILLHVN